MMKKLVILRQYFISPQNRKVRAHFVLLIEVQGWKVIVVSGLLYRSNKKTGVFKRDGLIVIRKPITFSNHDSFPKRIRGFFLFSLLSFFVLLRIRSRLIFVSSTPLTIVIPAIAHRFFTGSRYILEVRDVWPEIPIALGVLKNRILVTSALLLELVAYKYASLIVSLSPGMTSSIIRRYKKARPSKCQTSR